MNAPSDPLLPPSAVGIDARVPAALRAPRWWPAWIVLGLLRTIALLPVPVLLALGSGLGALFGRVVASRRRIVRINLRLCFPDWDEARIDATLRAHFRALGMGVFEALIGWWASPQALARRYQIEGLEHLQAAQARGGVVLLTGHFTTMEIASRIVTDHACRFHGMYRKADNVFFDWWIRHLREVHAGLPMLPKDDLKQIVRTLRRGGAVWYGPDQTIEASNAVFAPFFGVPKLTLGATARLAQMGRAQVVPYFPQRIGRRWKIVFEPALAIGAGDSDALDAQRLNALLERAIVRCPEQYFWIHRKFKYRPPGAPDVYARAA